LGLDFFNSLLNLYKIVNEIKEGYPSRCLGICYLFIEEGIKFGYDYFNLGGAWWRRGVIV